VRRFVTSIAIAVVLVQLFAIFSAYELATFDTLDSFAASDVMPVFARARCARWLQLAAIVAGAIAIGSYLRARQRDPRERLFVRSLIYSGLAYTVAAVFASPWLHVVAGIVTLSVPLTAIVATRTHQTFTRAGRGRQRTRSYRPRQVQVSVTLR
jgi:hypothetical protein